MLQANKFVKQQIVNNHRVMNIDQRLEHFRSSLSLFRLVKRLKKCRYYANTYILSYMLICMKYIRIVGYIVILHTFKDI